MPSQINANLNRWDERTWFEATTLAIAAALAAFGMILAIAANWDTFGRAGQFAIVGGTLLAGCAASIASATLRTPGLIVAFAATGGLFALVGQTFQTGADPWTLFAAWAIAALPFAVASRSDALWMPWSLVAMTGVQLWLHQTSGRSFTTATSSTSVYVSWVLSAGLILALLPGSNGRSELGTSRWSFRFAVMLGFIAIAGTALNGLFTESPVRYLLGLLACGGVAYLIANVRPVDLLALTTAAIAIDSLLVGVLIRLSISSRHFDIGSWLLIGVLSMAIVGGSVKGILAIAEDDPNVSALNARLGSKLGTSKGDGHHWPIAVLSTLGAIFATIPLVVVLGLLFGKFLFEGPGTYVGAAIILCAAGAALRSAGSGTFMRQFYVTILAIGIALLGFALYRDLPLRVASVVLSATAIALAFAFENRWIRTVLGALAAPLLVFACGGSFLSLTSPLGWSIIIAAWAVCVSSVLPSSPIHTSQPGTAIPDISTGAIIAALLSLSVFSGETFMLSGYMGGAGHQIAVPDGFVFQATLATAVSIVMAAAAAALALTTFPAMKSPAGLALALAALVLSYLAPSLGPVLVIGAVALATRRPRLAVAAVTAILWIVGGTYYALSMPLWMKGATLIATGLLIGGATALTGLQLPAMPLAASHQRPARDLATPLTLAGLAIVAALAGTSIWKNTSIIETGQRAYLALAPVDPRSLMQGDYMTLRFAITAQAQPAMPPNPDESTHLIIAKLDPQRIATFDRMAPNTAASQFPPATDGELLIQISKKGRAWIVGTDAFHFKEGDRNKFQSAAFGDFRFAPNGHPILVGLTDKDLKPLQ